MKTLVHDGDAVTISLETEADTAVRDGLLDRAMAPNWRKKTSARLRRGRRPAEGLAFVARDGSGTVVGTVRLWNVAAGTDACGRSVEALLLGPLAVEPGATSRGVGSALMRHALAEAVRLGHGAVLLVGDAPYYARFGFSAEKTRALVLPGPVERDRFLALEIVEGRLDGAAGMVVATGAKTAKPAGLRLVA